MRDLREFITAVEKLGELKLIEGADWNLEIGNITLIVAEEPNPPALLFDRIKDYKPGFRVFTIPYTSDKRLSLALRMSLGAKRLELVRAVREKLREPMVHIPPVEVKGGPVLENVYTGDKVDLFMFPSPQWQPLDGGRYIGTGDTVILKDPDEGWINVATHRIQIHDKTTATILFEPGKHALLIAKKYWERGQSCPVAVTCGSDPLHVFIGGSRVPWGVSEYDYLGWWQKEPVEVIKGPITGLPIPAYSEIALEGEILPPEVQTLMEGPFSEWTGHYTPKKKEAAFKVKSILHRNKPIMLGVLPYLGRGIAAHPRYIMGAAQVWNELDRIHTGVKGVWSHPEFGSNGVIVISLKQEYAGHAKQVAMTALPLMGYNQKLIIVVDEDVDPSDLREVLFILRLRSEPSAWDIIKGTYASTLDPLIPPEKRAAGDFTTSTAVIFACKPYHWINEFPPSLIIEPELKKQIKGKWGL